MIKWNNLCVMVKQCLVHTKYSVNVPYAPLLDWLRNRMLWLKERTTWIPYGLPVFKVLNDHVFHSSWVTRLDTISSDLWIQKALPGFAVPWAICKNIAEAIRVPAEKEMSIKGPLRNVWAKLKDSAGRGWHALGLAVVGGHHWAWWAGRGGVLPRTQWELELCSHWGF